MFWDVVSASTVRVYEERLEELRAYSPTAAEDFQTQGPQHFCRAHQRIYSMVESIENNMSESFNKVLKETRKLPIISLLEEIRIKQMERIARKMEAGKKWTGLIGPDIMDLIDENGKHASNCYVVFNGRDGFEVTQGPNKYVVNLEAKQCSCMRYTRTGIPCAHAICAIRRLDGNQMSNISQFVSSWYYKDMYDKAYGNVLQPMPCMKDWPRVDLQPVKRPKYKKLPGRPKVARRKDPDEPKKNQRQPGPVVISRKGAVMTCTLCQQQGHNKRGCPRSKGNEVNSINPKPLFNNLCFIFLFFLLILFLLHSNSNKNNLLQT
ncbi:MAG: SWIM zinc finger family protein ['Waltheria sp.' little leaf phytoplasma]|nr:SWIM zinc finger family protein ['Waltheria sp.' little leaf phytoplasma]